MIKRIILAISLFLFSLLLFTQSNQKEKVINIGIESDFGQFDPWESEYTLDGKIFWNVLEPLVILEENTTKIQPNLAVSWVSKNNNRTWIVKLREGVPFHDGSILKAEDVVALKNLLTNDDIRIKKVDNLTVQFDLEEPDSSFIHLLSSPNWVITSAEKAKLFKILKEEGRLDEFVPIGTGPFQFSNRVKGERIIFKSFDNYWRSFPQLDKIIYKIIPDNKARILALEKGEIDLIDIITPEDLPRLRKNRKLRILSKYGLNTCYLAINNTKKPLDDKRLRQALNYGIDKMKLAQMFYYGGYGVPSNRLLSPSFWGFSALPSPGKYDPEKARKLLNESQYNKDLAFKLLYIPHARPYLPDPPGVAAEIKRQLEAIVMKVDIIITDNYATYNSIIDQGEYDLVLTGLINWIGDPIENLKAQITYYNFCRWSNELFKDKIQAASKLKYDDQKNKIRLLNEAQDIVQEEVPLIPLFYTKIFVIHHRKFQGIIFYPSTMISFHKVTIEE